MDDPPDSSDATWSCVSPTKKTNQSPWLTRSQYCLAFLCFLLGNLSAKYVDVTQPLSFQRENGSNNISSNLRSTQLRFNEHNHADAVFASAASILKEEEEQRKVSTAHSYGPTRMTTTHQRRFLQLDDDEVDEENDCSGSGSETNPFSSVPFAIQIILIIILILFSALFSGLTLGLMGLDKTGLEIVMEGDDEANADAARIIYPVRSNGNLLLCTLLLGNVAVNAMLSILLADKAGGIAGFLASTFIIVIFGEIVPQALCQRYSLQIGSRAVPLVKVIMFFLYPITLPISFVLNKTLGHELATTYSNSEMSKLLEIHVKEGRFDQDTGAAMEGALKYKEIPVRDVMTPLENTFMLAVDEKLNFETVATIFKTGYSRIPVYEYTVNNIIGLLFVKDLIFIDPEDETPVRNFVQIFGRGVHVVWPDDKLGDVLKELKQGRSHMALVRDVNNENEEVDPYYEIKGIITLEDIIEEILGDEIVDETDAFVDGTHSEKVNRMEGFDWGRLRLLDAKIVDETLSFDESKAVLAHLRTNYTYAVSLLTDKQLLRFISETPVEELPTAQREIGDSIPEDIIYEKGVSTDVCTLILSGKVTVVAGQEAFRSDVSSWSVLAANALTEPNYSPDFTAFVSSGPCRCLRLNRELFTRAVDASVAEKQQQGKQQQLPPASLTSIATNSSFDKDNGGGSAAATGTATAATTTVPNLHTVERREVIQSRRSKLIATLQSKSQTTTGAEVSSSGGGDGGGGGKSSPETSERKIGTGVTSPQRSERRTGSSSADATSDSSSFRQGRRKERSSSIEYLESDAVLLGKSSTTISSNNKDEVTSNIVGGGTNTRNIDQGDV